MEANMAIVNGVEVDDTADLLSIPEGDKLTVPPQVGLSAIALNFAMKYADIITIKDGALYQQYKLEGRNIQVLHLKEVFYYAEQIEKHLLETPSRLANLVLEAVCEDVESALDEAIDKAATDEPQPEGGDQ
jgi:hypothetical protein